MQNRCLYCSEFLHSCGASSFFFLNMHRRWLFVRVFVLYMCVCVCVFDGTERWFVSLCFGMQHLPAKLFFCLFWIHFVAMFKWGNNFFCWMANRFKGTIFSWTFLDISWIFDFFFLNKNKNKPSTGVYAKQRSTLNWQWHTVASKVAVFQHQAPHTCSQHRFLPFIAKRLWCCCGDCKVFSYEKMDDFLF